jgi:polyisoprenoid-binding protein YceI
VSAIQTKTSTLIPTGTWTVDPVHSSIRFDVVDTDSMMKSISGRFTDFEGTVVGGEELFRVEGEIEWGPTRVEITADITAVRA